MAKQMVYFNATKQIETITIHYNNKLDGAFVDEVCKYITDIAKKMSKVNLRTPREYETIKVFVYPSMKVFNQIFGGVIEKRYYRNQRSVEDFYIVQDSEGNIHMASPRGKSIEKIETLKKILVMKILGEYMDEKDKQMADRMLRASMMKKKQQEEQEKAAQEEQETDEHEEELEEELEEEEQELEQEELEELIETEDELAEIDEESEENKETEKETEEQGGEIPTKVVEAREWLSIGWMGYLSGRLSKEKYVKYFADHISKNGVKKLGKLTNSGWYERYNYSQEYATAIVEYIVETYGANKLVEFYETPTDYKHVFGTTKLRFEQDSKAYIYSKYGPARMQEEIEERGVEEVTEVKLNNLSGAEITTVGSDVEERTIEEMTFLNLDDKI